MPYSLFLGASEKISSQLMAQHYKCKFLKVNPKAFWILDCDTGRIRLLGQYGIGLLQVEELNPDINFHRLLFCNGIAHEACITHGSFFISTPVWYVDGERMRARDFVAVYTSSTKRIVYQEWVQWDYGIDFLDSFKKRPEVFAR